MAHIHLENEIPGMRSLYFFRPDTGDSLYELTQILLRDESPLSIAERELIAAFVSKLNECNFCANSHAAAAKYLLKSDNNIVELALMDYKNSPLTSKLKSLLQIAECVSKDARTVSVEMVQDARNNGAIDRDIHDTVLIAATFCMFNRYVDGLETFSPTDPEIYMQMGKRMAEKGYLSPMVSTNL